MSQCLMLGRTLDFSNHYKWVLVQAFLDTLEKLHGYSDSVFPLYKLSLNQKISGIHLQL